MILRFVARRPRILGASEEVAKVGMALAVLVYFVTLFNGFYAAIVFGVIQGIGILLTRWEPDFLTIVGILMRERLELSKHWRAEAEPSEFVYAAR